MLLIVTGKIDSGKTSIAEKIAREKRAAGFLSKKVFENMHHLGYDLLNLETLERTVLARSNCILEGPSIGRYYFSQKAFEKGMEIVTNSQNMWKIIDEIGPLELSGKGFAPLLERDMGNIILVIRDRCLYACIQKWNLKPDLVLTV